RLMDPTTAIAASTATSPYTPTRVTGLRSGIGYVPTCAVAIFALMVPSPRRGFPGNTSNLARGGRGFGVRWYEGEVPLHTSAGTARPPVRSRSISRPSADGDRTRPTAAGS